MRDVLLLIVFELITTQALLLAELRIGQLSQPLFPLLVIGDVEVLLLTLALFELLLKEASIVLVVFEFLIGSYNSINSEKIGFRKHCICTLVKLMLICLRLN